LSAPRQTYFKRQPSLDGRAEEVGGLGVGAAEEIARKDADFDVEALRELV
jgi:hypothetical protein